MFSALVAVVNCGIIAAPTYYEAAPTTYVKKVEVEEPVHYSFKYEVRDDHTGDNHAQEETRNGHDVTGFYTLIDADGLKRTVEYKASEADGFNAVVRREPVAKAVPAVTKIVSAPTVTKILGKFLF